jgi:hypothetical protein
MPGAPQSPPRSAALLVFAALVGLLVRPAGAADPAPVRAFVVSESTTSGWLRIGARPGDLAIRSRSATAIVRKQDGYLVDFFRNDGGESSAPQLKGKTNVDGLWLVHPVLHDGKRAINLAAREVRLRGDVIEAESLVALGAGAVKVVTSYRLDASEPRLIVTSRFEHLQGGRVAHLSLGDSVKWGNVDYYVEGYGRTPWRFSAHARWIGRRGAGGDLMLKTLEKTPMRIYYEGQHHGLAPGIVTAYAAGALTPGETWLVQRTFSYETIPMRPEPEVPSGVLEVEVRDEADRPLAAKLSLRGADGTPDPDFGNDGDESGANRFVWSGTGSFKRRMPAGNYRVLATAGIERDAQQWSVRIDPGQSVRVQGRLPRVISTPGVISADLHLHQLPSVDADITCSTRVISVAAEGVEFAIPTDHYAVTDLAPSIAHLTSNGLLASRVITVPGSEISTVGNRFGHFNLYPMKAGQAIGYEDTTPSRMFAEMRKASPEGVVQVNHPRWHELGYFSRYRLDPKSARVPQQFKAEYDPNFDAIEIFNGVDATSEPKVRQVLFDWLHLLGQGYRYTATGNSDSHKLFYMDPGLPRNLVRWGSARSDSEDLDADPRSIVRAIRQGHVTVTSGPVLDVEILGKGPGDTLRVRGKHVPLRVRVRAAPWIDVTEVEVLLGPQGRRVRWLPVKKSTAIERLDVVVDLVVQGKTFVVVVAKGDRELPNVFLPKVRPYAFSNPIWLEPEPG